MNYYLVDYENVNKDGLNGVSKLEKDDVVCIFYTEKADSLTFGLHKRLNETAATVIYKKVASGSKNALDFQLSSYLGYIINENSESQYEYFIVSKDKGFECLVNFWNNKAIVKVVVNLAKDSEQAEKNKIASEAFKLLNDRDESEAVVNIILNYKTKCGINNALVKQFPSKNNQKASRIYSKIKPLIADKK